MSGRANIVRITVNPASLGIVRLDSERTAPPIGEGSSTGPLVRARHEAESCLSPAVDIYEMRDGGLILEADLPGANESSIIVQLEDNLLHLYAKIESAVPPGAKLIHEEYRVGDFARTFILSHEVDLDGIRAEWKQGVLRLIMPTSPRGASRRIEVKGQ